MNTITGVCRAGRVSVIRRRHRAASAKARAAAAAAIGELPLLTSDDSSGDEGGETVCSERLRVSSPLCMWFGRCCRTTSRTCTVDGRMHVRPRYLEVVVMRIGFARMPEPWSNGQVDVILDTKRRKMPTMIAC
jgi:hypothetical protein